MSNVSASIRTKFLAVALAATAVAFGPRAVAQSDNVTVQVPFAFENGSQHMPAGTYKLSLQSDHMLLIRGTSTGGFAMTNPEQALRAPDRGKVVFHKLGDRYFIREVWLAGSQTGIQCVRTRAEKQVQLALNTPAESNVELALKDSRK